MTVKNLIKRLERFDQDATVKLHHRDGEEVLFVLAVKDDNDTVWIETESDNDMAEEIQARFDAIDNGEISEEDMFRDMVEIGITPDMVNKYIGARGNLAKEYINGN